MQLIFLIMNFDVRGVSPLGIEPFMRDQRAAHVLYVWGFQAVRKTFQPLRAVDFRLRCLGSG